MCVTPPAQTSYNHGAFDRKALVFEKQWQAITSTTWRQDLGELEAVMGDIVTKWPAVFAV